MKQRNCSSDEQEATLFENRLNELLSITISKEQFPNTSNIPKFDIEVSKFYTLMPLLSRDSS